MTWEEKRKELVLQGTNVTSLFSADGSLIVFNSTSSDGTMHSVHFDASNTGIILTATKSGITELIVVEDGKEVERVDATMIEHKVIIDLSDEGDRWEGDVYKGQPCGLGTLWNSNNNMVFEGIRVNGLFECFGTLYYSDLHAVEYKGGWCGGKRNGQGIQYDRNGKVVYEGPWCNDSHDKTSNGSHDKVSNGSHDKTSNGSHDKTSNDVVFTKLDPFVSLYSTVETIRIKNFTPSSFVSFSFHYLPSLTKVFFEGKALSDEAINGSFSVYSCPRLTSFVMKPTSCQSMTSFSIYGRFHVSPFL